MNPAPRISITGLVTNVAMSGGGTASFTASDIATSADGARSVFAADMDGDGDMDIVSASQNDDTIAWYENNGASDPSWTADIATVKIVQFLSSQPIWMGWRYGYYIGFLNDAPLRGMRITELQILLGQLLILLQ